MTMISPRKKFTSIYAKAACIASLSCFLVYAAIETNSTLKVAEFPHESLNNVSVKTNAKGEKEYTITDLSYGDAGTDMLSDCVLSFNGRPSSLWKDDTRKYQVIRADYDFAAEPGALGGGCAYFNKSDHEVRMETSRNLWLGSCNDLGSFSIEMRFKAESLKNRGVLFSRIGYFSGEKRGIEIILKNDFLSAAFYKVFEKEGARRYDVFLNSGKAVRQGEWHHLIISYDRLSGKLSKRVNGFEDEVIYTTDGGEPYNNVYIPSFGYRDKQGQIKGIDLPQVSIGKDFIGYVDEFRISYLGHEELSSIKNIATSGYRGVSRNGRIPVNTEGVVTSPVYSFGQTGTMIRELRWAEDLPNGTFIWTEIRISDHLFNKEDAELTWYRSINRQRNIFLKKDRQGDYLRGKYYQWRIHLVPSPDGKDSPVLRNIEIDYQLDNGPAQPRFLEVAESGDEYVSLKWSKNVDPDLLGYRIYYGVRPGVYDGVISRISGKRITNELTRTGHIEIILTNDVIDENMALEKRGILSFPQLKNTVLYYFSVSAYDAYKPETPYNHESPLSGAVSARPYAGTEID